MNTHANNPGTFSDSGDIPENSNVQLKSLLRILQSQIEDVHDFLDHALDEAISITNSKIGYIFKYDEEKEELLLYSWSKGVMRECKIHDPPTCFLLKNIGLCGEPVRQRKPFWVNDFLKETKGKKGYPKGHLEIERFLTVPVFINDRIEAVIGVANKKEAYSETDVLHLQLLMDSIWRIVKLRQALPLKDYELMKERWRRKLQYCEQRYEDIVQCMDQGVAIHEAVYDDHGVMVDYRFLDINKSFETITGLQRENIIGKRILEVLPGTESYWIEHYNDVVRTGETLHYENYSRELKKHFEVVAYRNQPDQFAVIVNDITEKKTSELFGEVQYNIAHTSAATSDFREMFDITRSEMKKILPFSDFYYRMYDKETDTFTAPYDEVIDGSGPQRWQRNQLIAGLVISENRPLMLTGDDIKAKCDTRELDYRQPIPYAWIGIPVLQGDTINGVLVARNKEKANAFNYATLDILKIVGAQLSLYLKRLEVEKALKKHESLFKLIVDNIADNITVLDLDLNITYVSPSIEKIRGFTMEEAIQHSLHDIFTEDSLKTLSDIYRKELVLEGSPGIDPNRSRVLELQEYHKDGSLIWAETTVSFLRNESMQAIGLVVITRDITEKKRVQDELIRAKEKAEESDRLKSAFLANMSHEIRTPMNGILGFIELLKNPGLPKQRQHQIIDVIEKSGHRLFHLINDLIDISQIDSNQMTLVFEELDIVKECHDLLLLFSGEASLKRVGLKFSPDPDNSNLVLKTDSNKFNSIMNNLLNNAIKFTSEGEIDFGYVHKGEYIMFYIKDSGIGIPEDKRESVFNRFYQVDDSITRGYEGAGLGLSIAKAYVEMLSGKIWCESTSQVGTIFYFTHPVNPPLGDHSYAGKTDEGMEVQKNGINPSHGLKVLVAEDDDVSQKYMSVILSDFIAELHFVRSGTDAVEFSRTHPDIDLILMDIKMAEMDGLEATKRIRKINEKVIIIAQTAYALRGDRESALEAGCDDYISKPMSKAMLFSVMEKYFDIGG